ncbi:hypothetical protein D3C75_849940 [compost metagenome]
MCWISTSWAMPRAPGKSLPWTKSFSRWATPSSSSSKARRWKGHRSTRNCRARSWRAFLPSLKYRSTMRCCDAWPRPRWCCRTASRKPMARPNFIPRGSSSASSANSSASRRQSPKTPRKGHSIRTCHTRSSKSRSMPRSRPVRRSNCSGSAPCRISPRTCPTCHCAPSPMAISAPENRCTSPLTASTSSPWKAARWSSITNC